MKVHDRIVVTQGEHAGRRGVVVMTFGDPQAWFIGLREGDVRVMLDGPAPHVLNMPTGDVVAEDA